MGMLDLLDQYITKLSDISLLDHKETGNLIEEVARVFLSEEERHSLCLNYYFAYNDEPDLLEDTNKLKVKLEYEKALIVDSIEKEKRQEEIERDKRELEKLRLQAEITKGNLTINNNNSNHNEANSVTNVSVSIDQAIEAINTIPSDKLNDEEKTEIEEKLYTLEGAKNSGNKARVKETLAKVIKYIADKGIDVAIAMLPYLGEISKFIQGL